jgi:hypothetical protein
LNVDAKIGPKVLAHRIGSVLQHLLHGDQYGFVPGRDIRNAHLRFNALKRLCELSAGKQGGVLLDFAKAFDSVVWDALQMVLRHYGFGPNFRRWIATFLKGTLVSLLFNGSPLPFFELGVGVRQGDPLSPALFVLFIEPMLNYIRAMMEGNGITTDSGTEHNVISFADDCTGLLRDLSKTEDFLKCVQEYCDASGMKLNKTKTVVLPFTPWTLADRHLKMRLQRLGITVLENDENTKLLGIPYGPALLDNERLNVLLDSLHKRCMLWHYRARTLQGKVVILQQVILPLIWYIASVCFIPKSGFYDQVSKLIRRFMANAGETATPLQSVLSEKWWYLPKSSGGLGLTPIETSIECLQVSQLVRLVVDVRNTPGAIQEWADPILQLFDSVIRPWGTALDILYAPIATSPNHVVSRRPGRWTNLGRFWHQVLFVWSTKVRPQCDPRTNVFDIATTPLWHNAEIRPYAQNNTFAYKPTKLVRQLADIGICTPLDFFSMCGNPPNAVLLSQRLAQYGDNRAFSVTACEGILSKLQPIFSKLQTTPVGPYLHTRHTGSLHIRGWKSRGMETWKPFVIKQMILRHPRPELKLHRLGERMDYFASTWMMDYKRSRHVLPVYTDFLFRLKHNALHLGYRFQHIPDAITKCLFGCDTLETPQHLFWDCSFARQLWTPLLTPIQPHFDTVLGWSAMVFLPELKQTSSSSETYGQTLQLYLHCVRVIVLRCLWMHRNERRFQLLQANVLDVSARIHSLLRLHIEQYTHYVDGRIDHDQPQLSSQLRRLKEDFFGQSRNLDSPNQQ